MRCLLGRLVGHLSVYDLVTLWPGGLRNQVLYEEELSSQQAFGSCLRDLFHFMNICVQWNSINVKAFVKTTKCIIRCCSWSLANRTSQKWQYRSRGVATVTNVNGAEGENQIHMRSPSRVRMRFSTFRTPLANRADVFWSSRSYGITNLHHNE